MKTFKALFSVLVSALMIGFALPAHAQTTGPADDTTYVTFNQAVRLPGVTLPAGEYLFRLADPDSGRRVVQVLSADRAHVYAMLMGAQDRRYSVSDQPVVSFEETSSSAPLAIRSWFFPHTSMGIQFMYPTSQAVQMARVTHQPVLTDRGTYVH